VVYCKEVGSLGAKVHITKAVNKNLAFRALKDRVALHTIDKEYLLEEVMPNTVPLYLMLK